MNDTQVSNAASMHCTLDIWQSRIETLRNEPRTAANRRELLTYQEWAFGAYSMLALQDDPDLTDHALDVWQAAETARQDPLRPENFYHLDDRI